MPGVLFGVNVTPMAGVEVLHPERPNRNKLNVRRAIDLQSNRAENTKRQSILHLIQDAGSVAQGCEAMLMAPQLVRTFQPQIDKAMRWFPFDNFARPVNGKNSPAQRITDQGSFP